MEGRSHALSGLLTGTALSLAVLHADRPHVAVAAVLTAGAAVLPDLDHPDGTIAHTFGFATQMFAWLVGKLSGGHRHMTHSLLGAAVFTGLTAAAVHWRHALPGRIGLAIIITLLLASALRALKLGGHAADGLAVAGAAAMTVSGYGLTLMVPVVAVGCVTHLIGDGLTDEGVPLFAPLTKAHIHLLPEPLAFTAGSRPERWIVVPLIYVALAAVAWRAAGLGFHIHHTIATTGA